MVSGRAVPGSPRSVLLHCELHVHMVSSSKYLYSATFFFFIAVISLVICCFQTTQIRETLIRPHFIGERTE